MFGNPSSLLASSFFFINGISHSLQISSTNVYPLIIRVAIAFVATLCRYSYSNSDGRVGSSTFCGGCFFPPVSLYGSILSVLSSPVSCSFMEGILLRCNFFFFRCCCCCCRLRLREDWYTKSSASSTATNKLPRNHSILLPSSSSSPSSSLSLSTNKRSNSSPLVITCTRHS